VAVIEAALLVEAGAHAKLDRLVVVWCDSGQQIARLTDPLGRAMNADDATGRIAAQMPLDQKRLMATDEIDNSGTRDATRAQVEQLVSRFRQLAAAADSHRGEQSP
jgi:dephospho-CoA kinase